MCDFGSMAKSNTNELANRIESVVTAYLAECRVTAMAAIDASLARPPRKPHGGLSRRVALSRAAAPRRSTEEASELRERLHVAIKAHPGQTMVFLSKIVGEPSVVLHPSGKKLRAEGLVHTAGKLQSMRYFPVVPGSLSRTGRL